MLCCVAGPLDFMVNYDCQNYHDNKIAPLAYKDHKFLKNTHTHYCIISKGGESWAEVNSGGEQSVAIPVAFFWASIQKELAKVSTMNCYLSVCFLFP